MFEKDKFPIMMKYKALIINSDLPINDNQIIQNVRYNIATFDTLPTLHDFHIIFIDVDEILKKNYWKRKHGIFPDHIRSKIKEQIASGGILFCFSGTPFRNHFTDDLTTFTPYHDIENLDNKNLENNYLYNYFFCPIRLGIVPENGDTFRYIPDNLKYFKALMKQIPPDDVYWKCYFSEISDSIKILGVNRAEYPVFIEASISEGKLIMLPSFKNKQSAFFIIANEIIPQMILEEDINQLEPQWLVEMKFPLEIELRQKLSDIKNAKKVISTSGKSLEKAVLNSLKLMGFEVKKLHKAAHADIQISVDGKEAIVEVKGHQNRKANRIEFNQLWGYIYENEIDSKGILIVNHEFDKPPIERSKSAFSDDVINAAKKGDYALISCVDLFKITLKIIDDKMTKEQLVDIRNRILNGAGQIDFSDF